MAFYKCSISSGIDRNTVLTITLDNRMSYLWVFFSFLISFAAKGVEFEKRMRFEFGVCFFIKFWPIDLLKFDCFWN